VATAQHEKFGAAGNVEQPGNRVPGERAGGDVRVGGEFAGVVIGFGHDGVREPVPVDDVHDPQRQRSLVIGPAGSGPTSRAVLGATTRAILGRTRCPVAVVSYRRPAATRATW